MNIVRDPITSDEFGLDSLWIPEISCDDCHGTKYDERCWSDNDPHGGLGQGFTLQVE